MVKNKIIWILAILITIISAQQAQGALLDGLQLHYKMDSVGAPLIDSTGTWNLSTKDGDPQTHAGMVNLSVDYDGVDDDHFNGSISGLPTGTRSFQFWFNIQSWIDRGAVSADMVVWQEWGGAGNWDDGVRVHLDTEPKIMQFALKDNTPDTCLYQYTIGAVTNKWTHAILVWNSATKNMSTYINGTLMNWTLCPTMDALDVNNEIWVASSHTNRDFDGYIDEIYIWNRTLSQAEINRAYQLGVAGQELSNLAGGNLTINLYSNGQIIPTGNCTLNGTTFTTINGTINTNIAVGSGNYNVTCRSAGFYNEINTSYDSNNNPYNTNMTQLPFTNIIANATYTTTIVGDTITLTCTYTNPTSYNTTINYTIINANDSTAQQNSTATTYTLQNIDLFDVLNLTCMPCTIYRCGISNTTKITTDNQIDANVIFTVRGYKNLLISPLRTQIPSKAINSLGNPYSALASTFINATTRNATYLTTFTDTGGQHFPLTTNITINETQLTQQFNLTPYQLVLNFSESISGVIRDLEKGWNWTNSSLVVVQANLTNGRVNVIFNNIGGNWTQYYQYLNNYSAIQEDIQILQTADTFAYFQVLDMGNSPIRDAVVRVYMINATTGLPEEYALMGQKLSDADGYVYFQFDLNTYILVTVQKNGYDSADNLIIIQDEFQVNKNDAIIFRLNDDENIYKGNTLAWIPDYITTKVNNIIGFIYDSTATEIKVTTDYREAQGLGNYTLVGDMLDRYTFTLFSGTDFQATGTDNITVKIYVDGTLERTVTIEYLPRTTTEIIPTSTINTLDDNYIIFLVGLILIIFSSGTGIVLKNTTAGHTVFMIGTIIISFISIAFFYVTLIGVLYFALRIIHKVVSE